MFSNSYLGLSSLTYWVSQELGSVAWFWLFLVRTCSECLPKEVVLCNSVTPDMSGDFLLMMLLYLWLMLLVVCRSDYCNSIFRGLSKFNLCNLQCIQNSAARIVSNTSRNSNITPVLNKLHWLPVEHHTVFKTATLVYKFLHTGLPQVFCCISFFLHQFL